MLMPVFTVPHTVNTAKVRKHHTIEGILPRKLALALGSTSDENENTVNHALKLGHSV